jgi:hypothetical protein
VASDPLCSLCQALGVPVDRLVKAADSVSVCSSFLGSVTLLTFAWTALYDGASISQV